MFVSVVVFCLSLLSAEFTSCQVVMNNDNSGSIKFGPPDLNVEEESSLHMPNELRCDGCRVIAHVLYQNFAKEETKLPKSKTMLKESQVIDVTEKTCSSEFLDYGITQINGVKRLRGPGLDTENAVGVTQAGGKWPWRLQSMCNDYLGEFGEDGIYDEFKRAKNVQQFSDFFCKDNDARLAYCRKNKPKREL